jgi:DNA-binding protein YbaB
MFSEGDLEKAKAEAVTAAVEAERQKMQAEFAEKEAAATRGAAKVAVATFCDGLK